MQDIHRARLGFAPPPPASQGTSLCVGKEKFTLPNVRLPNAGNPLKKLFHIS